MTEVRERPAILGPDLSQAEIDNLCYPLTRYTAQIRFLEAQGLTVTRRPGGQPLVWRAHVEAVKGGIPFGKAARPPQPSNTEPDIDALRAHLTSRKNGSTNGPKTQGR